METEVKVEIIRDDGRKFLIDNTDWHIPSNNGLQGFGVAENEVFKFENAIGNGDTIEEIRMGSKDRTIVFHNERPRKNNSILRDKVIEFFNPEKYYKIYVTYMGKTRWCEGIIYKMEVPTLNINWRMNISITFLCPDPYMKSYDDFGKDIASIIPMEGFPYLCEIDVGKTTGEFAFNQFVVLNNDGYTRTKFKAVFKALGAVKNPKLVIGNYYVRVLTTLQENDVIEMDFTKAPPTIKLNNKNCIGMCDKKSAFNKMYLDVGDTEVSFDADEGTNMVSVSIYYNKLYWGI